MTTVGYDYFVKKGVTPGPGSHWGKALAYIAEIGATLKVTVSAPAGTLSGTVTVSASATPSQQASTITRVEFYVDSVLKATDTTAPYSFSWNTASVIDGSHQLKAKAFYPVNKTSEGLLTVTTYNTIVPPPPPPTQAPPANTTPPAISGTATEGQILSVSLGVWTNSPTSYTRQWLRCDAAGANAVSISGATGSQYTLITADVGKTIRCAVIAYNAIGPSPQVITAQTAVVSALAAAVPVNTALPQLSGAATQGSTLSVSNGAWTNTPTSYTYQWQRCGASIIGDSNIDPDGDSGNAGLLLAQSTTLAQAATIQSLSFYVTTASGNLRMGIYNNASGKPGTKLAETAEITTATGWNTANVVTPTLLQPGTYWLAYAPSSSTLAFRKTTDASSSNRYYSLPYGPMPATFSTTPLTDPSHWSFYATVTSSVSCADIAGQTANTYLIASADVGGTLRSAVKGVNASGSSAAAYSATTATAIAPPPMPPPQPPPSPGAYTNAATVDLSRVPVPPSGGVTQSISSTLTVSNLVTDTTFNVVASVATAISLTSTGRLERCVVNCNGLAVTGISGPGTVKDVSVSGASDACFNNVRAYEGCVLGNGGYSTYRFSGAGFTQPADCLIKGINGNNWCILFDNVTDSQFLGAIAGNSAGQTSLQPAATGIQVWTAGIHRNTFNILIGNGNPGYGFALYGGSTGNTINEVYCDAGTQGGDPAFSIGGGAHDNTINKCTSIGYVIGLILGEDVGPAPYNNHIKTLNTRNGNYPGLIMNLGAYGNVIGEVGGTTITNHGNAAEYSGAIDLLSRNDAPPVNNQVLGVNQSGSTIIPAYAVHLGSGTTGNVVTGTATSWSTSKILNSGTGNTVNV